MVAYQLEKLLRTLLWSMDVCHTYVSLVRAIRETGNTTNPTRPTMGQPVFPYASCQLWDGTIYYSCGQLNRHPTEAAKLLEGASVMLAMGTLS